MRVPCVCAMLVAGVIAHHAVGQPIPRNGVAPARVGHIEVTVADQSDPGLRALAAKAARRAEEEWRRTLGAVGIYTGRREDPLLRMELVLSWAGWRAAIKDRYRVVRVLPAAVLKRTIRGVLIVSTTSLLDEGGSVIATERCEGAAAPGTSCSQVYLSTRTAEMHVGSALGRMFAGSAPRPGELTREVVRLVGVETPLAASVRLGAGGGYEQDIVLTTETGQPLDDPICTPYSAGDVDCVAMLASIVKARGSNAMAPVLKTKFRLAGVSALGAARDPAAVPMLVPLLKDKNWELCCLAARALGEIGDRSALGPLNAALEAESKRRARVGLLRIPGPRLSNPVVLAALRFAINEIEPGAVPLTEEEALIEEGLKLVGDPVGPPEVAGTYPGQFRGIEEGRFMLRIAADGSCNATVSTRSTGAFAISGQVGADGVLAATTSVGPFTIALRGKFVKYQGVLTGAGTWTSSSGVSGTWTARRRQ